MNKCPLCGCRTEVSSGKNGKRQFAYCTSCTLVFVPETYHVSSERERERYALHDNTPGNSGYVRFLTEVADVISPCLSAAKRVLDYGCGEHAVLAQLLRQKGIRCDAYDPLYYPELPERNKTYDIIILCEVIEHCRNLDEVIASVRELLSSEGIVCVRTQCYSEVSAVPQWWYAQDCTHINFFSEKALAVVARRLNRVVTVSSQKSDIFLFT